MEFSGHLQSSTKLFVSSISSVLVLPHLSLFLTSPVSCVISLFQGGPGSKLDVVSMQHSGRHLLGFSPEAETEVVMGPETLGGGPSEMADR